MTRTLLLLGLLLLAWLCLYTAAWAVSDFGQKINQERIELGKGTPLPGGAAEAFWATPEEHGKFFSRQALRIGGNRQGRKHDLATPVNARAWTISLWIKGNELEPAQDVLWQAGPLTLAFDGPRGLRLTSGEHTLAIPFPPSINLHAWHYVVVTLEADRTVAYLDARPAAEAAAFPVPPTLTSLTLGDAASQGEPDLFVQQLSLIPRALLPSEINRLFREELGMGPLRMFSTVATQQPITLDGVIDPQEWRDATVLSGLIDMTGWICIPGTGSGLLSQPQSRVYVTYDREHLYLAMYSPIPDEVRNNLDITAGMTNLLKTSKIKHDVNVDADDAWDVNLVVPFPSGDIYRLVTNSANTLYDYTIGAGGGGGGLKGSLFTNYNLNWNPAWRAANTVNMDGWSVEIAIPFKDLAHFQQRPGDGTVCGINVIRIWKAMKSANDSWAWGQFQGEDRQYAGQLNAPFRFDGDRGVAVKLHGVGNPDIGMLAIDAALRAVGEARTVRVLVTSDSGEVDLHREIALPVGQDQPFTLEAPVRNPATGMITFRVEDAATGQPFYICGLPVYKKQALEITRRWYPSSNVLELRMDLSALAAIPADKLRAVVTLTDAQGTPVLTRTYDPLGSHTRTVALNTSAVPVGKYALSVTLFQDAKALADKTLEFAKDPLPEWYGNTIGIDDNFVPAPYTSLAVKGETVSCWGRTYEFGDGLFPAAIQTQGMRLLRAPINLRVTTGWGKVLDTSAARATGAWIMKKRGRVDGVRTVSWPELSIDHTLRMEYDGFLWSTITVTPSRERALQGLTLDIPLTPEFSKLINTNDYSLADTGVLPPQGWRHSQRPVWVGNVYGGIQWFTESTANWRVSDPKVQVAVIPGDAGATLRITFIDQPTILAEPLTLAFGLIATPVRDRHPEYRHLISGDGKTMWSYTFFPKGREMWPAADEWASYGPFIRHRTDDSNTKWWDRPGRQYADKVITGPYVSHQRVHTDIDGFAMFGDEWRANSNDTSLGQVYVTQSAPSYRDYFVWRYARLMEKNPFAALYYDVSRPSETNNRYGGGGALVNGAVMTTTSILGARDISKRLYHLVKQPYPDGIIKYHMSGQTTMAWLGFCDAMVDGENTASLMVANPHYPRTFRKLMTPARFQAEYMGHNFGPTNDWLPQFTRSGGWNYQTLASPEGVAACDQICGLALLHDSSFWPSYMTPLSTDRMRDALHRHHWGAQYRMIPYWEQTMVSTQEDLFVSLFVEPAGKVKAAPIDTAGHYYRELNTPAKKVILIAYNDSEFAGQLTLQVDWKRLGFSLTKGLRVENAVHHTGIVKTVDENTGEERWVPGEDPTETAEITDGKLVFPMTPYNYRMIVIERP